MSEIPKTIGKKNHPSTEESIKSFGELLHKHIDFTDGGQKLGKNPLGKAPEFQKLKILRLLKPIPWILCTAFLFSFYWDFNNFTYQVFGTTLQLDGLLRIISVSGMIGFLTNWIAISMLFRPLKKRPLLGQGLIPAHKERIAYRLAFAVSEDLINSDLINLKIRESQAIKRYRKQTLTHLKRVTSSEPFRKDLKGWLMNYIRSIVQDEEFKKSMSEQLLLELEDAMQDKILEKAVLKTYSYFRGQSLHQFISDLLDRLPVTAERNIRYLDDYLDNLPSKIENNNVQIDEVIAQILNKLVNQLDVHKLVEENLRKYDEKKLENMIRNATNEQLKTIQYLGALLGTIGGFIIWEPIISLILLSLIFGTIYIIDRYLFRGDEE
ncbi:MAG: DUF445 family protein [Balneolaceae bacterium]